MVTMVVPVAMVTMDRIEVPVMARLDQNIAAVMVAMMTRRDDHLAVMAMMVVMPMAGFDHDRLRAGGARQKQCRNPGEQKLPHFTFS
jgi:hypothetical protein